MANANIASRIIQHPDKDEIIAKLLANVSNSDIAEWLSAKYDPIAEKKFILSEKSISIFQKEYLDFYTIMKDDLIKSKANLTAPEQLQQEIQGTAGYHRALEKYAGTEVDVKSMLKKMVVNVEVRVSQMFDMIQEDPQNTKPDRTLIEWFNTMMNIIEKYDAVLNGAPEQINIQNNINIQVVDDRINMVYNIIKEILSNLDYDTSLLFIDRFNEEMKKIESKPESIKIPVETRLKEATILSETISKKLIE